MRKSVLTFFLLFFSFSTLTIGLLFNLTFNNEEVGNLFWLTGALSGLIPAIKWLIDELQDKQLGSDVLAIFSIVGAVLTKEFLASSIIAFMLATGRALESWAEGRAERQLKALVDRIPKNGNKVLANGSLQVISLDEIEVGDELLVKSGEIVPVDGALKETGFLDQSALTGEPIPVLLKKGELALSGTLNAGNNFILIATTTAAKSTYSGIVTMVRNSQTNSSPNVRLANKWALRFVPFTLIIATGAWLISGDVSRAVAVLVVATPCPLILAVPIALVAGMSRAARFGAVIKGGAALEKLARTEVVLLDKTGTLTHGGPVITEIATAQGFSQTQAILIAASLDQYSPHVVAKTLVDKAMEFHLELLPAESVEESHGKEVTGIVEGKRVTVGAPPAVLPEWGRIDHPLLVALHIDNEIKAVFGLDDPIRSDSAETIGGLAKLGIHDVVLVTGDRAETANHVASTLGISRVVSSSDPAKKLEVVREYKGKVAGTVIVVGDGINDAPALAESDVGVAMGARGATAASEAAQVVIVEDSISHLVRAISISRLARQRALQASLGGMVLAIIAMAIAAFGGMSASQGALTQEVIDVIAIFWALSTLRGK